MTCVQKNVEHKMYKRKSLEIGGTLEVRNIVGPIASSQQNVIVRKKLQVR
jgi:hypothetical protein